MSPEPKSIWQREILPEISLFRWPRRFLAWLFSWRGLRRILILLAWAATLMALFYAEENWRGHRAWKQYRRQLEASGAQLDLRAFLPKEVPDEQNFCATPFLKSWFIRENLGPVYKVWQDSFSTASLSMPSLASQKGERQFMDLVAWARAFDSVRSGQTNPPPQYKSGALDLESRAEASTAVLEGLKSSQAHLSDLVQASHRLFSRYPIVYNLDNPWGILLPHLARLKDACQRLQIKACAELAAGQGENTLAEVELMLFLADSMKGEPFLISYVVRLSLFQLAVQPIWEGIAEQRWSESQLKELQSRLLQYDFITDMQHPLEAERAAALLTCDLLARGKYTWSMLASPAPETGTGEPPPIAGLIPRGWYDREKIGYCRLLQVQWSGKFDASKKRVSPVQIQAGADEMTRQLAGSAGAGKVFQAVLRHRL